MHDPIDGLDKMTPLDYGLWGALLIFILQLCLGVYGK
jgi:hypothetical protein